MDTQSPDAQYSPRSPERRRDDETRLLIDQAIRFRDTLGRAAAVSFLVEHHVPPPVLQRVMMNTPG